MTHLLFILKKEPADFLPLLHEDFKIKGFSSSANKEATRDGASAIDLVDRDQLCELLKKYSLGVETVEKIQIKPVWFKSI